MTPTLPIALLLDSQSHARLQENGLFHWWIHNVSGAQLALARIDVIVVGAVRDLEIYPSRPDVLGVHDGGTRCLSTAFKATVPGHYALRVKAEVRIGSGPSTLWECPDEISLTVSDPDEKGEVNMIFNQPGLLKGYLPPGSYSFNAEMVVKPEAGSIDPRTASPQTLAKDLAVTNKLPPVERQLSLPLVPVSPPGLDVEPEMALFARHWVDTKRPKLVLDFVDDDGNPRRRTVRTGQTYRLKLQSYRGGHITLISQGCSGRFFQLAPHRHWGQQVAPAHTPVVFPDDILSNLSLRTEGARPDPAWRTAKLPVQGLGRGLIGWERALAIVSPAPIAEALEIYAGDDKVPNEIDPHRVRALLGSVMGLSGVEIGYTEMEVLP